MTRIAGAGFLGFTGLMLLATAIQPDSYQWQRYFISGLAAMDARYPALMIIGFQCGAAGLLATAWLVARRFRRVSGWLGAGLLVIAGLALSVAGWARFDCGRNDAACQAQIEAGMSWHSELHGHAALFVFLPLILAPFVLAIAILREKGQRRGWWAATAVFAGLADLFLIVTVEGQLTSLTGLWQRLSVLTMLGVPLLIAAAPRMLALRRPVAQPA
jgi:hypothetical protein